MIGTHDVLLLTLDALRWDVARDALAAEKTPYLAALLPDEKWQMRHSAGSFTLAAHAAFFAGFLPTPVVPGTHPRLFAARFEGSETTDEHTFVFDAPDLPRGLAMRDYYTICIGGVGFFNKRTPLGCALPDLFQESHWNESFGVTNARSTENQVACAVEILKNLPRSQRVFLFLNISAMHQPNCIFLPGTESDSVASQAAALAYVDARIDISQRRRLRGN